MLWCYDDLSPVCGVSQRDSEHCRSQNNDCSEWRVQILNRWLFECIPLEVLYDTSHMTLMHRGAQLAAGAVREHLDHHFGTPNAHFSPSRSHTNRDPSHDTPLPHGLCHTFDEYLIWFDLPQTGGRLSVQERAVEERPVCGSSQNALLFLSTRS